MPKDAAVGEFARLVRALKARDGRSYEALGRRLSVGASTLHRYCSGATVPEEFTVVDRLALLCGADEEERRVLAAAWTEADRARRRAAPPVPAPVPPPAPTPVPSAPEPSPAPEPTAPDPNPDPEPTAPDPSPDPEPTAPNPDPEPSAPHPRPRRTPSLPAPLLVAGAVVLVVLALAAALLGRPSRTPSAPAIAPTPASAPAPSPQKEQPVPFTWTVGSQLWQGGCGHTYLVDRAPRAVAPPPVTADAGAWAGAHGAVHGGETLVRATVQGRSPSTAVVLHALHVRVVGRAAPPPWNAYRTGSGCGGAVTPRHFAVDLDRPRPLARPVDGRDASGDEPRTIPAVSFPYKVTASDPEELLISARTAGCDCRWYLELEWSSGERSGTVRITDGGKPFRTSGTAGRPTYAYDTVEGRWITDAESGQSG
ncbi:helix-turn-helix domain-containing protein [Streptomyces sp. NPDC012825]|uniref:helix-turn-helix domain-containing protein n=1 Tax=Streptomyces sp. NPDC012825 TaxID=3364851 RepID=UPI00368CD7F8